MKMPLGDEFHRLGLERLCISVLAFLEPHDHNAGKNPRLPSWGIKAKSRGNEDANHHCQAPEKSCLRSSVPVKL